MFSIPSTPAADTMRDAVPAAFSCPIVTAAGGEGAARRRLHAIHPAAIGQEGAAAGFALAFLAAIAPRPGLPLLWVQERQTIAEAGLPYGPGLLPYAVAPAALVVVVAKGALEALAAAEMGLEEPGLAGVVVELSSRLPADMLKLTKRLSFRAEARAMPCLMLHASPEPTDTSAATRWSVAGRPPERLVTGGLTLPDWSSAFDLVLSRNRFGSLGRWAVRWDAPASTHPDISRGSRHAATSSRPRFTVIEASAALGNGASASRPAHSRAMAPLSGDGPGGADVIRLGHAA